ncbi:MAG: tetratricopeptide repeat protein [Polyangiaceae bacterium]|nr:tetratricopeptide repeat protein [Polyangiaceae bacterium]
MRWVVVAALLAAGCVKQPGAEMKGQLETVRREHTWEKLYEKGRGFAAIGDQTRAEQYLAAALDAGGDGKKILPLLMSVCVEAKKLRVAIDYGESYLKKNPTDTKLRHLLGTLYLALGENQHAREQFEEVLRRAPDEAETHYALGVLLRDVDRDLVRADQHFRAYVRIKPGGVHAQEARSSMLKSVP